MHNIYSFCHPMKMCFSLSCFHIAEVKMLNSQLNFTMGRCKKWVGHLLLFSILFFTVLLGLFFEGKPSSSLHMWVSGLLFAAMWAHQVFDVSIPLLQTQSCHGNTLGEGKLECCKEWAKGDGQLARPLLWVSAHYDQVWWWKELWPNAVVDFRQKLDR